MKITIGDYMEYKAKSVKIIETGRNSICPDSLVRVQFEDGTYDLVKAKDLHRLIKKAKTFEQATRQSCSIPAETDINWLNNLPDEEFKQFLIVSCGYSKLSAHKTLLSRNKKIGR